MMKNDGRIGFHLDVRPSLDSFESIKCRVKVYSHDMLDELIVESVRA